MVRTVVKAIRFGTNGLFDPRLRRNLNPIVTFETRDDPRDKEDFIMNKAIIAIAGAGLLASACASDPYGYNSGPNQSVRQGAIGAGLGAVAGAIVGNNVGGGNAATGAAIGALAGGAAGAIRGSNQDRNNQQRYRDNQGRYYYCYDNRQTECYWENGQRRY